MTRHNLLWLLGDHPSLSLGTGLGSTSRVIYADGSSDQSRQMYKPWGETRWSSGTVPTTYQFTGQRHEKDLGPAGGVGLYFYGARWYDPAVGRFIQADTILTYGVQGQDRYAYVNNNPLRYTDPTGHDVCDEEGNCYNTQGWYRAKYAQRLSTIDTWKMMIWGKFGITMAESNERSWSFNNLNIAYNSLEIENEKMNGKLKKMVGGTTFTITDGGNQYYGWTSDGYHVAFHVASNNTIIPMINFLHETGHVINFRYANAFSGQINGDPDWTDEGFVDSDILVDKTSEPVQALPEEAYSSDEYWADAYANYIIDNINLLEDAGKQMSDFVKNALDPYINPQTQGANYYGRWYET